MTIQKIKSGRVTSIDADTFVGPPGTLFFNEDQGDLRLGDGVTPGGIPLSFGGEGGGNYVLPTATTTVKGGVKIDGTTIAITNQVIRVGTVPYSSLSGTPTIPTNNNQLTNGAAYITSSALTDYALTSAVPTNNNQLTNGAAYITSAALSGLASETYVTTRGYITSAALSTYALTSAIPTDINQLADASGLLGQGGGGGGTTYITNTVENPYSFSIAGDDSTLREIASGESIKITGAGGITVTTDAEGNITITGSGGSVSSLVNGAYTVSLGSTGTLTVPANGIITAPINQEFQLQAKDANSVLRNEINLDPNNGTYMSVWSEQTTSFSSADWGSGSWNNESGLGAARFTDAQALQNFWTTGIGSLGLPIEASINGGARTPNVFYENNNGGGYGVLLGLDAVPPGGQGTTVPITTLVFYYQLQSRINIDATGSEILLDAQSMDLDLRTTNNLDLRANQNLNLRGLGAYPVRIYTNGTTHMWEFDNTGSLTLPQSGKLTFSDATVQSTAWTGIADYNNLINKPNLASTYTFNVAADDSTMREISSEETVKFVGAGGITTASDAEGNITITGPNLSSYATETYVTSRGYITGLSYNDLSDKPNLAGTYTFNVAADDSTMREISSEETVKFVGAGGITTASDAEGKITITQGTTSSLVNGANTVSLGSTGTVTFPNGALKIAGNTISNYVVNDLGGGSSLSAGSQLEVALAKTVITSGTTNSLDDVSSLTNQCLFEVNPNKILNAFQVISTLGDGGGGLTSELITELDNNSFKIGQRVTNDLGGDSEPLTSFSGWTFGSGQSQAITFPDSTVQTTAWNGTVSQLRSEGNINIEVNLSDSTKRIWQFGEDGALTLPANGNISVASGNLTLGDSLMIGAGASLFSANETGLYFGGQNSDAGTYIQIPGLAASEAGEPLIIAHNWDADINIQGDGGTWSFGSNGSITFPDSTVQSTAWTGVADYNNLINKPNLAGTYQFSVAADDSTQRVISTDELVKFVGAGGITTASDAEGNITITGPSLAGLATETYVTTQGYITSSALTGLATESYVTSRGYITGLSYNDLTDKPNLAGTYSWSIAADDSTQLEISAGNLVKIVGAQGVTTSSNVDGQITITGPDLSSYATQSYVTTALSNSGIIVSATAPAGQPEGKLWYNSASLELYVRYDSAWVAASASFSGDYNDLTNKPTNVSQFANDANYVSRDEVYLMILELTN